LELLPVIAVQPNQPSYNAAGSYEPLSTPLLVLILRYIKVPCSCGFKRLNGV
jgi:hypothetical protein